MQKLLLLIVGMALGAGLVFLVGRHTEKNPFYAGPAGGVEVGAKTVYLNSPKSGRCLIDGMVLKTEIPSEWGLTDCQCRPRTQYGEKLEMHCAVSKLGVLQGEATLVAEHASANRTALEDAERTELSDYSRVDSSSKRWNAYFISGACDGQVCKSSVWTGPDGYVISFKITTWSFECDDDECVIAKADRLMSMIVRSLTLTDRVVL